MTKSFMFLKRNLHNLQNIFAKKSYFEICNLSCAYERKKTKEN